jgi:hypothetical protein
LADASFLIVLFVVGLVVAYVVDKVTSSGDTKGRAISTSQPEKTNAPPCDDFQPQQFKPLYCNTCFNHKNDHKATQATSENKARAISTSQPEKTNTPPCDEFQPQQFKQLYCNTCFNHKNDHKAPAQSMIALKMRRRMNE